MRHELLEMGTSFNVIMGPCTRKAVKEYILQKFVFLQWPAKSPDLSIIENYRENLPRDVYQNGRQL